MDKTLRLDISSDTALIEAVVSASNSEFKEEIIWQDKAAKLVSILVEKDSKWYGIRYKKDNVIILPYMTNEFGLIEKIGMMKEFNPLREGKYSWTLISGTEDDRDETSLETAKRELKEESGYLAPNDNWHYLGTLTTSKIIDHEHPCFAVNLTDIKPGSTEKEGIGEELSNFEWKPLSYAIRSNDSLVLSLILKFYLINFKDTFIIKEK